MEKGVIHAQTFGNSGSHVLVLVGVPFRELAQRTGRVHTAIGLRVR